MQVCMCHVCVHVRPTLRRARLLRWSSLTPWTHLECCRTEGRMDGTDRPDGRTNGRADGRTDGRTHARTHARMHTRKDGRTDGRDAAEPRSRQRPLITLCSLRTEAIMPSKVTFDLPCALLVLSCPQHPVDHATVRAALTLWQGANLCKPRATPTQEVTLRVPSAYLVHSNLTACSFKW